MNISTIEKRDIRRVRSLDVEWAHDFNVAQTGRRFREGRSSVNGKLYSADANALIALHKLRSQMGNSMQRSASQEWLGEEGLAGLYGKPLSNTGRGLSR